MQHSHAALAVLAFALLAAASRSYAQDMEPRAYGNAPIGLNFLIAGYARAEGGVAFDPTIRLTNANIRTDSAALAYARSFEAWGRSAKLDLVLPRVDLSGTAELAGQPRQRDVAGWADPRLRLSINLYGAPALRLPEFTAWRQDLIIGVSLYVWAPLGQYDADKLVNIGSNRWAIKPELGLSKAVGRWIVEIAAAAAFYGDNDEYLVNQKREQDPVYSVQGSATYNFVSGAWAALSGTWYEGGRTTIDGVRGNNLQSNSRVGVTVALPVGRQHSIKLYATTGVSTRTGTDFDVAGIAWQYRWGGGL
jgi:Putative MetA-pathway of phenol degradation